MRETVQCHDDFADGGTVFETAVGQAHESLRPSGPASLEILVFPFAAEFMQEEFGDEISDAGCPYSARMRQIYEEDGDGEPGRMRYGGASVIAVFTRSSGPVAVKGKVVGHFEIGPDVHQHRAEADEFQRENEEEKPRIEE